MDLRKTAMVLTLGMATLATPLAFGAASDEGKFDLMRDFKTVVNKDGMVSKKDFLAMMEKKFDAMDTGKKGMLSVSDIMRIFSDKTGQ